MDLAVVRDDMVEGLEHPSKGVLQSEIVGLAMRSVPRHEFIDTDSPEIAYADKPVDYHGTTILSPSMVALLLEALDPHEDQHVLVVGAGVGYTAAVLAEIVGSADVSAIDLSRRLVWEARRNLSRAGYDAVLVDCRDGAEGLPEYAPFDRILVEAAAVKPPDALVEQLAPGGRLVMPLGAQDQECVAITEAGRVDEFGPVQFKPLLIPGEEVGGIERNRAMREDQEFVERSHRSRGGWEHGWIDWDQYP